MKGTIEGSKPNDGKAPHTPFKRKAETFPGNHTNRGFQLC